MDSSTAHACSFRPSAQPTIAGTQLPIGTTLALVQPEPARIDDRISDDEISDSELLVACYALEARLRRAQTQPSALCELGSRGREEPGGLNTSHATPQQHPSAPGHTAETSCAPKEQPEPQLAAAVVTTAQDSNTDEETCTICYEPVLKTNFFPCGHWTCSSCAPRCQSCPFCRGPTSSAIGPVGSSSAVGPGGSSSAVDTPGSALSGHVHQHLGDPLRDLFRPRSAARARVISASLFTAFARSSRRRSRSPRRQPVVPVRRRRRIGPECEVCGRTFGSTHALEQHKRDTWHEANPAPSYQCWTCERSFGCARALKQHRRDTWH